MLTGICLSLQAPALAIHPCSARVYPYTRTSSLAMQPICNIEPHLALPSKRSTASQLLHLLHRLLSCRTGSKLATKISVFDSGWRCGEVCSPPSEGAPAQAQQASRLSVVLSKGCYAHMLSHKRPIFCLQLPTSLI